MKFVIGDYFIETDERQYKVKTKLGVDKKGNDTYKTLAYLTTLTGALKFIPQQVIRDNDDINLILSKLEEIELGINAMEGNRIP